MASDGFYYTSATVSPPTRVRARFPAAALPRDLSRVFDVLGGVAIGFAFDVERYGPRLLKDPRVSRSDDGIEWTLTCSEEDTAAILAGAL